MEEIDKREGDNDLIFLSVNSSPFIKSLTAQVSSRYISSLSIKMCLFDHHPTLNDTLQRVKNPGLL